MSTTKTPTATPSLTPGQDSNTYTIRIGPFEISFLNEPFFLTAKFWKRFSVFFTVALSIASLVVSAIASLRPESARMTRAMTVTGIVINAVSISISALTSLDWKAQSTHDKAFADQLLRVSHVHEEGGKIVIDVKDLQGLMK